MYCPTNSDIYKFQDSTEVLPILGCLSGFYPFGISQFCNNLGLNFLFLIIWCPFFCGQDNLLGGQFWAMGRLNLLGGQINLLGGQMPTHLTCHLPPCIIMPRSQRVSFLGPALTVISANVEGFPTTKQQILAELYRNLHCDVLCLQDTHRGSDNNRPSILSMVLVTERPHCHGTVVLSLL